MALVLDRPRAVETEFHQAIESALRLHDIRHANLHDRFYIPEFFVGGDLTDTEVVHHLAQIGVRL